ncbi:protein of unknown function [Kyrpidia spormannii]|uniref:Uncharacterized protein n=2 Tax=Kyrpidia spormannii TaxID=2055160 RepID=A0ACA8ZDW5_9BACL|nr:protein of unknown function [Kyrpidia spormannii]CAB3395947.1 protein of unknown function [Kyrpidia spormannii]
MIRYRQELVDERTREANRIQKVLEGANVKLSSVATDILGKSGREILKALIEEQTDPEALADMAKGRMKANRGPTSGCCCGSNCVILRNWKRGLHG